MVKATRTDITVMVAHLDDLIVKPKTGYVPKLSDINILQEDLKKIMSNIDHCLAKGSEWNLATFGCTREQLVDWRSLVNATKADLDHKDSERRKAADSRVDVNSKGKKADWPQIAGSLIFKYGITRKRTSCRTGIDACTCAAP